MIDATKLTEGAEFILRGNVSGISARDLTGIWRVTAAGISNGYVTATRINGRVTPTKKFPIGQIASVR